MLNIKFKTSLRCSFCSAKKKELIKVFIFDSDLVCNNCIIKILYIYKIYINFKNAKNTQQLIVTPKNIKYYLDKYIIGQEEAKQIVSVSIYNHYKRLILSENKIEVNKANILLIGNTGTGKTLFAKSLARFLNLPLAIVDATSLTEAGYVGDDVENILTKLLQKANFDLNLAEKGIIFIDEIDKISKKSIHNTSITRDVSGEGVQQALLKILEGSYVNISTQFGRKHPENPMVSINTKDILFLSGGTFAGLDEIVYNRLNVSKIGFNKKRKDNKKELFDSLKSEDLINFGFIPEFLGRWPIICQLQNFTEKEYKEILLSTKNSILKQYKNLLKLDKIDFSITKKAIELIIKKAMKLNIGARGLHYICEKIFNKYTFSFEWFKKKQIKLTKKAIQKII
ncbi:ATP-dependent Clp protease ATP-binding subunit ClpX [Candidatus Karelsulcia muelleri]|nr:ATP-dependent Clp protease ATP-binding subunit ClpX [Candidatus Karelsulcia muelleri]WDI79511.1 ATP-dependent Clp protease ATP-binding subunit ClpX [Candidatus Karelsulcia muelleri]WDR78969.1 ATP-dependent Clp protease ATP-binding subunit ClpX [Candidatus Karelsulcia muelleri]